MVDRVQFGAKNQALEVMATARETFTNSTRTVKEYISKQPARAIGIALGMGVLLGWLIKRR